MEQRRLIAAPQARHGHRRVGDARVAQLQIGIVVGAAIHLRPAVQADMAGVVEPHPILPLIHAPAGDKARGGLHPLHVAGQAVFVAVAADAAGAVAAHLPHGAVGVEEQHPIIAAADRRLHHHEAVGPDGQMPPAQGAGQLRPAVVRHGVPPVIHHDKVVARAVHLPEFHGVAPLRVRPRRDAFMRSIPQGAAERTCFSQKISHGGAWDIFCEKQSLRHKAEGTVMYGWGRISPTG